MPAQRWVEITFTAPRDRAEALQRRLESAGAVSVSLRAAGDEALLEPAPDETPLWTRVAISGLFDAGENPRHERERIEQLFEDAAPIACRVLGPRDLTQSTAPPRTRRYGRRLCVVPTAEACPDGAVCILLEPGLAFGSGAHPTTALCLEWLDAHPPEGLSVMDYGCGSGILGIAAARLGARRVDCVDHDPQALEATRRNARRNGCEAVLRCYAPAEAPAHPAQVLLANILARPLLELAPAFARRVVPGGHIVLSGLLPAQCGPVGARYLDAFEITDFVESDGWARIDGVRRQALR